ncbi:MAG: hypothetical protein ABIR06_13795 [Cyclobacteriaceae bacterium]
MVATRYLDDLLQIHASRSFYSLLIYDKFTLTSKLVKYSIVLMEESWGVSFPSPQARQAKRSSPEATFLKIKRYKLKNSITIA